MYLKTSLDNKLEDCTEKEHTLETHAISDVCYPAPQQHYNPV